MMRTTYIFIVLLVAVGNSCHAMAKEDSLRRFNADHPFIQYTGRIDFNDPLLPRFWQPGVYITVRFAGPHCEIILNDEVRWGKNYNYLQVTLDGRTWRLQTSGKRDTIRVKADDADRDRIHTLIICKNTEGNTGYLELAGIRCSELMRPPTPPMRKIEFIGNSITCGTGSDVAEIPCGKGEWHDQHNAWLSYGPLAARTVNAQYHLSSVSGIGLMHSCCGMNVLMPQVFDKIDMYNDTIRWDFKHYEPDVVTVCLGQNDGIQEKSLFIEKYISFIRQLRKVYPGATIVCTTSPMADAALRSFMKPVLSEIVSLTRKSGDSSVYAYFFSKQYNRGCDGHPDLAEHALIAGELSAFIKQVMNW